MFERGVQSKLMRILLTGDDGYTAIGTRLLIHLLKDQAELFVASTREQQSGVGGRLSMRGFEWQRTTVDGVEAFCVEGSPVDAVELATIYFKEPFDLVISGVNLGANLSSAIFSSGTVNAALRAVANELAHQAVALSWDLPGGFHLRDHDGSEPLTKYLKYPGKAVAQILELAREHQYWQSPLLNINFPQQPSTQVRLTKVMPLIKEAWGKSTSDVQGTSGHFDYSSGRVHNKRHSPEFDVKALTDGYISISPCLFDISDHARFSLQEYSLK